MNTPADPDGTDRYAELDAMIASGVADPESWYLAAFTPTQAVRWDGFGWTAESVLSWSAELRADPAATAAWLRAGMMDPLNPSQVLEALHLRVAARFVAKLEARRVLPRLHSGLVGQAVLARGRRRVGRGRLPGPGSGG